MAQLRRRMPSVLSAPCFNVSRGARRKEPRKANRRLQVHAEDLRGDERASKRVDVQEMSFQRKYPPKPDRSAEFASFVLHKRAGVPARIDTERPTIAAPMFKATRKARTRHDLRDAARGQECTIRITGCCNGRTDTTVGCHWPGIDGGRGMGIKSVDAAMAWGCSACHDVVDGRAPIPPGATRESVAMDWCMGLLRTLERLTARGLL